jgi:ferredoxin
MKKAAIFCYSGTGNTLRVMNAIVSELTLLGIETKCFMIHDLLDTKQMPDISDCDAVGIGYPIYGFNVPRSVARFLRMLPRGEGRKLFIFKSGGEPFILNTASSGMIYRRTKRKGYVPDYERLFLMPYNIMFRNKDAVVKQMWTLASGLARKMARDLKDGIASPVKALPWVKAVSLVFRLVWLGGTLNGRMLKATPECNLCMKCVRECRTRNITLENRNIRFDWQCDLCMRCVMYCPKQAIRAGLFEKWAVRGEYDFERIMGDERIPTDYIDQCEKGFIRYFRKYVQQTRHLIGE